MTFCILLVSPICMSTDDSCSRKCIFPTRSCSYGCMFVSAKLSKGLWLSHWQNQFIAPVWVVGRFESCFYKSSSCTFPFEWTAGLLWQQFLNIKNVEYHAEDVLSLHNKYDYLRELHFKIKGALRGFAEVREAGDRMKISDKDTERQVGEATFQDFPFVTSLFTIKCRCGLDLCNVSKLLWLLLKQPQIIQARLQCKMYWCAQVNSSGCFCVG